MDLTTLFPCEQAVRLGGKTFLVLPLRIRDLAVFQEWLNAQVPSPFELRVAELDQLEPGSEAEEALLGELYEAQESWPVQFGSPEGEALLGTTEGVVFQLLVILGRCQPFSEADARELVAVLEPGEWGRLQRLVFGLDGLGLLERRISPGAFGGPQELSWCEWLVGVCKSSGLSLWELGEWSLPQLNAFLGDGKAGEVGPPAGRLTPSDWERRVRVFRRPKAGQGVVDG